MISFLHISSSPLIEVFLGLVPAYLPPRTRLSNPRVSMGEEGVVIIALVIPDSRAARDYPSDPLRTVSGAVKTHS